jgi:hypothetical protein
MFRFNSFIAAPALSLLLCGTAHAALTADQVWQSWKDVAGKMGLEVTAATESSADGVVTLNGVKIAPPGAPVGLTISDVVLTTEDDGSVSIVPGTAIGADMGEEGSLSVMHEGLVLNVSEGEGGAMVYDYTADKLGIVAKTSMEGYSFTDQPAQRVTNDFDVSFEGLAGTYTDTPGANRAYALDLAATKLAYTTLSDDPNMKMKTQSSSETADVTLEGEFVLPATMELATMAGPADFGRALQDGLSVTLSTKQGVSTGTASQEDEFMPYSAKISAQGGEASFSLGKDGFDLATSGDGFMADVTTPAMPAPIQISSGPIVMNMKSPILAGPASDYGLVMKLSQFTLNDEVWGMFDPGNALPREPFDLAVDVSGTGSFDWIGMMEADTTGAMPPMPAPETLNITEMALKVAGAAASATGAFTFDNSMGMPMPLGEANVNVTGANALIDGLIATGIITEEDAMGARMMMGMFMAPGAEPDSLTSKIEMKEGMAIFVNGQQIQ